MVKTLGEIINEYRKTHKMSMDSFANKSGISKPYISMLEKNYNPKSKKKIVPTIDTIAKCAKAMNMEFDDLFNALGTQKISTSHSPLIDETETLDNLANQLAAIHKEKETLQQQIDEQTLMIAEMLQKMTEEDRNKTFEVIKAMFPDLYKQVNK